MSLTYFYPLFMSLTKSHPVWTCAESPFEVKKAVTMANMLSGRYVTDHRARHWSATNPQGNCQLCMLEKFPETPGTLEHLLLCCPALAEVRKDCTSLWSAYMVDKSFLLPIVSKHTVNPGECCRNSNMQILLDPTSCPLVIAAVQQMGPGILSHLMYLSRTWCSAHHLRRRRILKLYNVL